MWGKKDVLLICKYNRRIVFHIESGVMIKIVLVR